MERRPTCEELEWRLRDLEEQLGCVKQVEKASGFEEERILLSTAIEQAAEAVVITDVEGTIQYINPAFEKITGYAREEVIGRNPRILKSGEHDASFYKSMWDRISSGEVWTGRIINRKKDGTLYEEEVTISPVRGVLGRITNYVAVKRDMTREAQMEQQLCHAQKMEAIGTLAGGIAHDFNNILGAIVGYTELALYDSPKGSVRRKNLKNVLRGCQRAKELVDQILTFSRQSEQGLKAIQLTPVVKEALKLLRASLPSTIEIISHFNITSDRGDTVLADSIQVHQILMNLCTNAAHSMHPKGGALTVEVSDVDLDFFDLTRPLDLAPGPYVRLAVSDTGCGMDEAVMERIFEPYFTTKEQGEGTGLGLSVVHGIVKSQKGAITAYSEPGKGTTFDVYLPRLQREIVEEAEGSAPLPEGKEAILFVDDEAALVDAGRQMLELLGYRVDAKMSSIEALECFKACPDAFDLIVTDQTMPRMTGVELIEEARRLRPDIRTILCTGSSEFYASEKTNFPTFDCIIMKPLMMQDLAVNIRRVLDEKEKAAAGAGSSRPIEDRLHLP